MILRIEDLKDVCSKILSTVDANELSVLTETLELRTENKVLYLAVTNREYYAQVKLALDEEVDFHATVNANLFLKLVSQTTTDTVELTLTDNVMVVKGNGTYKLPLIFDGEKLLDLPKIVINNVTSEFDIAGSILTSILNFNSKELSKSAIVSTRPVQKMYYVDEQGAITFTTGACVNSFTLEKPVKILLNNKVVKLFKLFKDDNVHFTLGYDAISNDIIQTKVKFENADVSITAILSCDDTMLASVPVDAIRGRATSVYPFSITINRDELIQTINRLLLFTGNKSYVKPYSLFEFTTDSVTIFTAKKDNSEKIFYVKDLETPCDYKATLDLVDLKLTLEGCSEQYINMSFGDEQAVIVTRGNVCNVIPEVKEV